MDNSLHGLLNTICDNKSLVDSRSRRNSEVLTRRNCPHGDPRVIITDRGAVFRSRLVSSLVDLCNIDHRFTTAYHPPNKWTDGTLQ
ncbi:hypothetical protein TNCV_4233491 [Trichonephila clavipes]|nr:hypothetical protein TNCV_4233491 [Trichonephila clavipes]